MNRFNPHWRLQFLALLMLAGLATLLGKLWYVQVAHGPEWTKFAEVRRRRCAFHRSAVRFGIAMA